MNTSESEQESLENLEQSSLHLPEEEGEEEVFLPSQEEVEASEEEVGEHPSHPEEEAKKSSYRLQFEQLVNQLGSLADVESKLQTLIDFMESSLAQSGTPHFKSFWEARSLCLDLFKENVNPVVRSNLWNKYQELSKEARRLKEMFDEQSAFAVEQIEMAVKALEDDLAAFDDHLQRVPAIDFGPVKNSLLHRLSQYQDLQRKLNLLNTQASRINALRKELIRTEMRVRQKNKFFQRLSAAGDKVFPYRKELIKEISQYFNEDVEAFTKTHFSIEQLKRSLFGLREEIKALQNIAKILTLNTHAFTQTRLRLSECWDLVRNEEKDRKKERSQQKALYKQNFTTAMEKIQAFEETQKAQPSSANEANRQLDEVVAYIKSVELGREELDALREEVKRFRQPILEQIRAEEQARQQMGEEKERQRRQKVAQFKQDIDNLIQNSSELDLETLTQQRDALVVAVGEAQMMKVERQELERLMKPLRDIILEKKESSLLNLSDDDRQAFEQLKVVLQQRKERRQEIKDQIDTFRKAAGASGLDFEQAMKYNEMIAAEKERLEKANQGVQEIERKIAELSR